MGEIEITGPEAVKLVQWVSCNNARKARHRPDPLFRPDDRPAALSWTIYSSTKFRATHYLLCVNAGNQDADFAHIVANNRFDARVENTGPRYSQLADSRTARRRRFCSRSRPSISLRSATTISHSAKSAASIASSPAPDTPAKTVSKFTSIPQFSEKMWNALTEAGKPHGMIPCGLGARNTLRLEAGMCLYGHEIDDTTTPWEAGLGWICKLEKAPFLGSDVLAKQKQEGVPRKLVGFEMLDKRIGRDGYPVSIGGREAARVTSGGPSPFLKKNIGMAYVPPEFMRGRTPKSKSAFAASRPPARIIPHAILQAASTA